MFSNYRQVQLSENSSLAFLLALISPIKSPFTSNLLVVKKMCSNCRQVQLSGYASLALYQHSFLLLKAHILVSKPWQRDVFKFQTHVGRSSKCGSLSCNHPFQCRVTPSAVFVSLSITLYHFQNFPSSRQFQLLSYRCYSLCKAISQFCYLYVYTRALLEIINSRLWKYIKLCILQGVF